MKKILSLIGIIALISLMFVPLVSAYAPVTIFNGGGISDDDGEIKNAEGGSTYAHLIVGGFEAQDTGYLTTLTLAIKKVAAPNAIVEAVLYDSTLNLAAVSTDTINTTTLTTSYVDYTFQFNQTYLIGEAGIYWGGIRVQSGGTIDPTNYITVEYDHTDFGDLNNYAYPCRYKMGTTWYYSYHTLCGLYIMADELISGATPTPTPAGGSGTGDADMEALVDAILPWLVPLLICLIPALLGYKFVGELGFFIGLNVGVILAYVTLAGTAYAFPLWGIILVGVMDVAIVLMRR